jgi:hypothetical protein
LLVLGIKCSNDLQTKLGNCKGFIKPRQISVPETFSDALTSALKVVWPYLQPLSYCHLWLRILLTDKECKKRWGVFHTTKETYVNPQRLHEVETGG